ncbi:MAG: hypothetical protein NE328_12305 [Lentisphaeraceae bacterium]|nr:hypothetical protein [Lentisphaeraceae bacterium]
MNIFNPWKTSNKLFSVEEEILKHLESFFPKEMIDPFQKQIYYIETCRRGMERKKERFFSTCFVYNLEVEKHLFKFADDLHPFIEIDCLIDDQPASIKLSIFGGVMGILDIYKIKKIKPNSIIKNVTLKFLEELPRTQVLISKKAQDLIQREGFKSSSPPLSEKRVNELIKQYKFISKCHWDIFKKHSQFSLNNIEFLSPESFIHYKKENIEFIFIAHVRDDEYLGYDKLKKKFIIYDIAFDSFSEEEFSYEDIFED